MSFSLLMTWQRVLQKKRRCKKVSDPWTSNIWSSKQLVTISIKQTGVVYQPAPRKSYKEPTITVKVQRLQVEDKFTYLGSTRTYVCILSQSYNATAFYFENISYLVHVSNQVFLLNESAISQSSYRKTFSTVQETKHFTEEGWLK